MPKISLRLRLLNPQLEESSKVYKIGRLVQSAPRSRWIKTSEFMLLPEAAPLLSPLLSQKTQNSTQNGKIYIFETWLFLKIHSTMVKSKI